MLTTVEEELRGSGRCAYIIHLLPPGAGQTIDPSPASGPHRSLGFNLGKMKQRLCY
jgi:hypothetical protein